MVAMRLFAAPPLMRTYPKKASFPRAQCSLGLAVISALSSHLHERTHLNSCRSPGGYLPSQNSMPATCSGSDAVPSQHFAPGTPHPVHHTQLLRASQRRILQVRHVVQEAFAQTGVRG